MENVYQEKSSFKFSKRKALVIALSIFAVAIVVSEPAYASVPWWITGIGAVAGGIVGSLTGSPIGTIAGAAAGAMLANYLYCFDHKTANCVPFFPNQNLIELEYASSYENITTQELINNANTAKTTSELFTEDYYYNAQQQEALVPYFLGNSSLNLFNISLASGTYATINNVSYSIYSPEDTVLWQTFFTGYTSGNNAFTLNQSGQTYSVCGNQMGVQSVVLNGIDLNSGDYIFVNPQNISTSIFRYDVGKAYLNITNFYTNKAYNITSNFVMPINTSGVPYGLYRINAVSANMLTSGIEILPDGDLNTIFSYGGQKYHYYGTTTYTFSFCNDINGSLTSQSIGYNMILSNTTALSSEESYNSGGACYSHTFTAKTRDGTKYLYQLAIQPQYTFNGMTNYYTTFQLNLNNIYSAANAYFNALRSYGYTNINQLPAKDIIPFPSDAVPSSLLNDSLNWCEIESIYIGYMNDLNNTFHNTELFNGKNYTKFFNQTMFVNGFLTVYGNLSYSVDNKTTYVNQTDFFIQTYTNKLHFAINQTTNLTNEIYPVLILNGTQNGTLLYVDASIYVIGLKLAGKNITSYTLEPEVITYVLPKVTTVGPPKIPAFIIPGYLTEYLIIAALVIAVLAAVITGMVKKGKKDKKKRAN